MSYMFNECELLMSINLSNFSAQKDLNTDDKSTPKNHFKKKKKKLSKHDSYYICVENMFKGCSKLSISCII